jgi:hypothetical protein
MDKLIGMTYFVLKQENVNGVFGQDEIDKVWKYANFLKQSLCLWMFVACKLVDGVWVALRVPDKENYKADYKDGRLFKYDLKEYQQAKEACIFTGFELDYDTIVRNKKIRLWFTENKIFLDNTYTEIKTIEDLVKHNLTLTETAKKKLQC